MRVQNGRASSNTVEKTTGLCKGEALLHTLSGLVLVPFGAGLTRCTVGETCHFFLADCGGGAGKALPGLHLQARFVGPAIFMPHLSLVNTSSAAAAGSLLMASFCPPVGRQRWRCQWGGGGGRQ